MCGESSSRGVGCGGGVCGGGLWGVEWREHHVEECCYIATCSGRILAPCRVDISMFLTARASGLCQAHWTPTPIMIPCHLHLVSLNGDFRQCSSCWIRWVFQPSLSCYTMQLGVGDMGSFTPKYLSIVRELTDCNLFLYSRNVVKYGLYVWTFDVFVHHLIHQYS